MDNLLAGYESDSEESSSSAPKCIVNFKSNQETKATPISSLLGDGVDSCSSSSGDDEKIKHNRSQSHPSCSPLNKKLKIDLKCHTQEKKNQMFEEKSNSFLTRNGLPSPRTAPATSVQSPSMITWTIDYISQESRSNLVANSTDICQFLKFKKLAASQSLRSKKGWAAHLRNQHEFHNPHFIQSVMEHFGINESLGSQA